MASSKKRTKKRTKGHRLYKVLERMRKLKPYEKKKFAALERLYTRIENE
jgi:hypothetical protein